MVSPDFDFETTSLEEIAEAFFKNGCVLLRGFAKKERLAPLIPTLRDLYDKLGQVHVFERDMLAHNEPRLSSFVFDAKHTELLNTVFGETHYEISDHATHARRVSAPNANDGWQAPLGYHLDAGFHTLSFTVNFWIPFCECGEDAPSLAVVQSPIQDMLAYSEFDGREQKNEGVGKWMFGHFKPVIGRAANGERAANVEIVDHFGEKVWCPNYNFGDAMMISNYTMHGTHVTADMKRSRESMELRFTGHAPAAKVINDFTQRSEGAHVRPSALVY